MKVQDIEIPLVSERGKLYRFFEILPGAITWTILISPFILSLINPTIVVLLIIAYLLLWFVKSIGLNIRAIQGFKIMELHKNLDWGELQKEIEVGKIGNTDIRRPAWHFSNLERLKDQPSPYKPSELIQVAMIATWNESREVLEPTIQSILDSDYDMKKVILVIAYEDRGGPEVEARAKRLVEDYRGKFMYATACKHVDLPGEIIGKGGNITYAGRELEKYLEKEKIDPLRVIVTTLDADNRPHSKYFAALTYAYSVCPEPRYMSFQPIPMYTNNIWDAPAPMRVIATGNSFWNMILSLRPHMLRNFSSHAQSMQSLIDTDYWSVRTIVEDGHQYWRTYFRYDGKHEVLPIYVPIYQDAVFADGYFKTLKAQFVQLRRWAWGASDIAYVATTGFFKKNKVPKLDLVMKFSRLLEGHITWAVAPLVIAFSAFIPPLLNPKSYAAVQLPIVASRIETIALVGIFATLFISFKTLPPKPARYKSHRNLFMLVQWVFLPVTTIAYNSVSALYSQTRLMFGKYIGKFDVTEKAVKTHDNRRIT